jgi:hypothetical protein
MAEKKKAWRGKLLFTQQLMRKIKCALFNSTNVSLLGFAKVTLFKNNYYEKKAKVAC